MGARPRRDDLLLVPDRPDNRRDLRHPDGHNLGCAGRAAFRRASVQLVHVEAADAQGDVGPASAFATISVNFPPTPIAPVSGSVLNTFTPTFSWSSIPGAISYQLQLTNTTTGIPLAPISVTGTSFTLVSAALLDDDAYTWGVAAVTLERHRIAGHRSRKHPDRLQRLGARRAHAARPRSAPLRHTANRRSPGTPCPGRPPISSR